MSTTAPAVFLGALASEVDEPDALPEAFAHLAVVTEQVVALLRNGQLSDQDAAATLANLWIVGEDSVSWCLGATTLRWYRRTGEMWKLGIPPREDDDAHRASLARAMAALPERVLDLITPPQATAATYAADPFAADGLQAPWEFEVGDDRRMNF